MTYNFLQGLAFTLCLSTLPALGAEMPPPQKEEGPQIYGAQLMTVAERATYRERLQNAETDEERARIMAEHHVQMQERAKAQGVTLPEHTARARVERKHQPKAQSPRYEAPARKQGKRS